MLELIRSIVRSWYMKGFLFLIAMTFVSFYGLSDYSGCSPDQAAQVRGQTISLTSLEKEYRLTLQNWSRNEMFQKQKINADMQKMILQNTLQNMINRTLLNQEAAKAGLLVSDKKLTNSIKRQIGLSEDKNLDKESYGRLVQFVQRNLGLTLRQFEDIERRQLITRRFVNAVQTLSYMPEDEVKEEYIRRNEKVELYFEEISRSMVDPAKLKPTEGQLKAHYEANLGTFQTQEKRAFRYVSFGPPAPDLPDLDKDETQRQELAKQRDTALKNALLEAKNFAQLARKNDDFSTRAAATQFNEQALMVKQAGPLAKGGKLEEKDAFQIVKQAFKLQPGEISEPLEGWSGAVHVVQLETVTEPRPLSFTEAHEQVEEAWTKEHMTTEKKRLAANMQKQLHQSADPLKKAKQLKLEPKTTGLFARVASGYVPKIGSDPAFSERVFDLQPDKAVPEKHAEVSGKILLYWLKERQPADLGEFEKLKTELIQAARQARGQKLLEAWLQQARESADKTILTYPQNIAKAFPDLFEETDDA